MPNVSPLLRERVDYLIEQLEPTVESDNIYYQSLRAARAAGELDRMTAHELCSLANWLDKRLTLAHKVRQLMVETAERKRLDLRDRVETLKNEILAIDPLYAFPWDSLSFEPDTRHGADFRQRRRFFHHAADQSSMLGRRIGLFAAVFISTVIIVLLLT